MALIITCRKCNRRLPEGYVKCSCGSSRFFFIVDYRPAGYTGKRIREPLPPTTASISDAWEIERLMRKIAREKVKPPLPSGQTVDELFPEYLEWYKLHRAASSYRDVVLINRAHYSRLLGGRLVSALSEDDYDYYQKMRALENVKNRTINKELEYFGGFVTWCRRKKKISVPSFSYEKLPYKKPIPIILSFAEVVSFLKAAQSEPIYYTLALCLYSLSLRFTEAITLKLENFDFGNQSVKVRQKGGSEKVLPLNNTLIKAVRSLIKEYNLTKGDYLFANPRTGRPLVRVQRAFARIAARAKISKKVTPHLFRHTFATHMLGQGVDIRVIQKFLGHAQVTTTEIYTHVVMANLRTASNKVLDKMALEKALSTKNNVKLITCPQGKRLTRRNH